MMKKSPMTVLVEGSVGKEEGEDGNKIQFGLEKRQPAKQPLGSIA